jgi:DHA2 family multidrug resistance protein-like MFS transporter
MTAGGPGAGRRKWMGLGVLSLACLLIAMDLSVLDLAVPALSADLRPSSAQLLWIVDVYGFVLAGSLITMGTLGDRIGRRRLLMIGAGSFGAMSVVAAFSTTPAMLIAARAALGVAAATLMPSTLALIRTMFDDPRQRTTAMGVWAMSLSLGGGIGPLIGGALLELFWWGSVFLIAVPIAAGLLTLGPALLPEARDPQAGRLDLISAGLSLAAVLAVIYGLKQVAQDGLDAPSASAIVAGLALGVAFVRRQRGMADPLVDVRLFRIRAFSAALVANALGFFVVIGMFMLIAQYLQLVLGMGPFRAGLWTLPSFAAFTGGSLLAPVLVRHLRVAVVVAGGLALAAVGVAMLTLVPAGSGLAVLVTGSFVFSLGFAPVFTLAADVVVGAAPSERAGAASALSETATELGGALGIAILGSIGTAVYRSRVADAVTPGVDRSSARAARDTLGGAVGAADQLSAGLLHAARQAFTEGLHAAAATSAVIVAVAAVAVALLLRDARPAAGHT